MNSLNRTITARTPRPWLMPWLLACVLLLAQTLGMMHGVVHGPQSAAGDRTHASSQVAQIAVADTNAGSTGNWVDALFSSHHGDNDCRLFDQASHGSAALHVAPLALPVLLPSLVVAIFQGAVLARWAALFDARGPPLTS